MEYTRTENCVSKGKIIFTSILTLFAFIIMVSQYNSAPRYLSSFNSMTSIKQNLSQLLLNSTKTNRRQSLTQPTDVAMNSKYLHERRNNAVKQSHFLKISRMQENISSNHGSPRIVLILAYMHTGSSYTGQLLELHPGTFYSYEPLRTLQHMAKNSLYIKYLNGTSIRMSEKLYNHVGGETVKNMFSCNYDNVDVSTLAKKYGTEYLNMRDFKAYYQCLKLRRSVLGKTHRTSMKVALGINRPLNDAIETCLPKLIKNCQNSNMRAMKMIRMHMAMAEPALRTFPNMRIIHLLRDPRAMLDSNVRKHELKVYKFSEFKKRTVNMCKKMLSNFQEAQRLKALYPGQIFTLRYEDMVREPIQIAKSIYDFIQVPFSSLQEEFVRKRSIDRTNNSTVRANKWRHHISYVHLHTVEKHCHHVFDMFGYLRLGSIPNVRNLTISDNILNFFSN